MLSVVEVIGMAEVWLSDHSPKPSSERIGVSMTLTLHTGQLP